MRGVLETERLLLRRFTLEDVEDLAAIYADAEFTRFLGGPRTVEQARAQIEWSMSAFDEKGIGFLATILKESNTLVGRCGLLLQTVEGVQEPEIAYGIARPCWGQGLATEAARALKQHGFRDHRFPRLISLIDPLNVASQRVAEKNGMRHDRDVDWRGMRVRVYLVAQDADPLTDQVEPVRSSPAYYPDGRSDWAG